MNIRQAKIVARLTQGGTQMGINRRDLFKYSGGAAVGVALAGAAVRSGLAADDDAPDAAPSGPIPLSGNENNYGPSPATRQAVSDALIRTNRYGFSQQFELIDKIALKEGVTAEHIVLGSGSSEVLCAAGLAYCRNGGETVAADLGFGLVPGYVANVGGDINWVPLDAEMKHDLKAMDQRVTQNTGVVYICNPNNPTGTLVDNTELRDFCTSVSKRAVVLVDEAYLEYADDFEESSVLDLIKQDHNVVLTRTFSKIHGLAGLRMGYAVARPDIAQRIARYKMCKFQGPLGVTAASVSLNETEFQGLCRARVKEGRELVYGLCDELGIDYVRGAGNFVFIDPKLSNAEFKERMLAQGIGAARPFPPKPDWARVTIGTTEEMKVFAEALPKVLDA